MDDSGHLAGIVPTVHDMHLHMTVVNVLDATERAVEVRAEAHHTLSDLLTSLDAPQSVTVCIDGDPVPPSATIGLPPLLDGAVLVLGHTPSEVSKSTGTSPLRLTTTTGPDAGRALALRPGRHVIGRGEAVSLRVDDDALSREHFSLTVDRDGVLVHDLGTTNGTEVEGVRVPAEGARVRVGQSVRAGRTTFAIGAHRVRPSRRRPTGAGTLAVNPVPHLPVARTPARITLPAEPTAPPKRRIPWVMVLIPLPFAGALALVFGPRMLLFALLSPLLAIASTLSDRSNSRHDHREARAAWQHERARSGERLSAAIAAERRDRLHAAPDAATLLDAACGRVSRLWERRPDHVDHLSLRLGLATLPAQVEVEQSARERTHPVLEDVPLTVDLAQVGVLGIAGEAHDRDRLASHLLGQLTVLHSHHDLRISIVADGEGWWSPFAPLVHLREHSDLPGSARVADDTPGASAMFAQHAQLTRDRAATSATQERQAPTHVIVVDGISQWRSDPSLRTVFAQGGAHGVLVIAMSDTADELPHECGAVVRLAGDTVDLHVAGRSAARGTVDAVGPAWCLQVASALAPLRDATPDPAGGGLPTASRLLDVLALEPDDPAAFHESWSRPDGAGRSDLEVVVGTATDADMTLDLRRDGPHALVGGTTGSGKSEFLQTWVMSLAAHLSPEEITFVLVDYKGGAAFAECARLPHTVGLLTDLDPEQAERALTSLDAEMTRRERILAASGATDIDDHSGDPLPRLVIVIDEFRMLAEEQPDALAHLMRIAAVGRSLGVHLILATQRPGGIVSADIKANVNLRIALRVRDRVDSDDVIGTPAAVDIPVQAPGRALARTGGSPARAFQTGRVAGHASTAQDVVLVRDPGTPWPSVGSPGDDHPTDIQRLVTSMTTAAAQLGITPPHRPWLPPLAEIIPATALPASLDGRGAPFALVDQPDRQRQVPLCWSPADGHWMVIGGPGTGRTTSIAALVGSIAHTWTPARVQVQIIGDGSSVLSGLAELPHVGSVIDGENRPVLRRFLTRLESDVAERRSLLRASGHATLDAWWTAHDDGLTTLVPPPHLLLAIDGWGRVTGARDTDLGESADALEAVLRDGAAAGLRALVTGGRELLSGRISSLISSRLVLHLPDRGDASLAGLPPSSASTRAVPGRARHQPGGDLVHIALPSDAPSPTTNTATTTAPWCIEPLPEEVCVDTLAPPTKDLLPIGVGTDDVAWRVAQGRRLLVCGPAGSGRTTTLATIAGQALDAGYPVALLASEAARAHPQLAACPTFGPDERDRLIALRQSHHDLVLLVDDIDRLEGSPVADVITEILRRVDTDSGLVVATTTTQAATTRVRGPVAEIARWRTGILLQPSSRSDGDALGTRVPPLPRVPGRGYFISDGRARELQIARASSAPAFAG